MFGFGSDKMDFRNVHKLVQKEFDNFEFKVKSQDDDRLELNANITASNYFDDDILVKVVVYKGGTTHVFLTFDKLDESLETLRMINAFNDNTSFFKAYISEKDGGNYLELHATTLDARKDKDVASTVSFLITNILSDSVLKYLQPLTELTY